MIQKEFDFDQPAFIKEEIRRIPGTYSGITKDGRVWNYRKGDWHRLTTEKRSGTKRVGICYVEDGKTKLRSIPALLKVTWGIDVRKPGRRVPVYVVETGEIFPTQTACANALGFNKAYVSYAVKTGLGIGANIGDGTVYHIRRVENDEEEN